MRPPVNAEGACGEAACRLRVIANMLNDSPDPDDPDEGGYRPEMIREAVEHIRALLLHGAEAQRQSGVE